VKNVLLSNASLLILFLSDTYEGSVHDKPIADAMPYPLPGGSKLLQDLQSPGRPSAGANRTHHQQCQTRIVKDTIRRRKYGARDLVMEVCCALHNFRVRIHPWPSTCT
jgi:hypothetical protein